MAVLGRLLVSSAERLDLPDLLSLDSYAAGDWKFFLKGIVGDSKPYILKGFDVIDPENAIGTQSCSIRVADSIVFYPGSNSGSFYHGLPEGHAQALPLVPELRKNAVNYVYLTFSTFNTSVDTRAFWDPDKDGGDGGEFTQDVNTESVLSVEVNVSTGSFPVNTIPVAKITVGAVVITAIEDARDMMFRLGSGGISPNPFNTYSWRSLPNSTYQRSEPPTQMSAGGVNPFQGGDKNILSLKEWMDAVMSKLRELGGSVHWYDDVSTFGVISGFYDAVASTFKSKGTWVHDTVTPGLLTWTEDVQIKMTSDLRTYILRQGSKTLTNEQVMYIPMVRNQPLNSLDQAVSWTNGQPYVNTVGGAVGYFANLAKGDYVKKSSDSIDKWLRVEEFYDAVNLGGSTTTAAGARSIRLSGNYAGTTGVEAGRYDKGAYLASDAVVSARSNAAIATAGGNFHWLALRSDTIENTSNIVSHTLALAISEHDGSTAKVSCTAHGLVDGDRITISGTTNFNGTYQVEVETANIFYITKSGGPFANESGSGFFATITTSARSTTYGFQEESANHGFASNDTIIISGTTNYNASYLINVTGATTFTIPIPASQATETSGQATLARLIIRSEGGGIDLIQGQVIDIGGSIADNIRQYLGMGSLSQTAPAYAIAPGYNTLDGMANYNGTVNENITARISKLTAMMADKAQDKTVQVVYGTGLTTVTNTTNGAAQEVTFAASGSTLYLTTPGSTGQAAVTMPFVAPGVSLLVNQSAYVTIDRNNTSTPSITVANIASVPVDENVFILLTRLASTDIYLWNGQPIPVGPYVLEKADRNLGNLTAPTVINQDLNPVNFTDATNFELGSIFPFSQMRSPVYNGPTSQYTLTGDFTQGSAIITNIVGTLPTWTGGIYTVYAPGIVDEDLGVTSFSGPTSITMDEVAESSGTGVTFYLNAVTVVRSEDQTVKSGAVLLKSGNSSTHSTGTVGMFPGDAVLTHATVTLQGNNYQAGPNGPIGNTFSVQNIIDASLVVLTSGTVTANSNVVYVITNYVAGDNFTNIGGTNVTGNIFRPTGTTPTTWTNGSSLQPLVLGSIGTRLQNRISATTTRDQLLTGLVILFSISHDFTVTTAGGANVTQTAATSFLSGARGPGSSVIGNDQLGVIYLNQPYVTLAAVDVNNQSFITTEIQKGSNPSAGLNITSGSNGANAATGQITLRSGEGDGTGASGAVTVRTGVIRSTNPSGNLNLTTGGNQPLATANTGTATLSSGFVNGAGGNSGAVTVTSGQINAGAAGSVSGAVNLNSGTIANTASTGATGLVNVLSGANNSTVAGTTGPVTVRSGSLTGAGSGTTGATVVTTGSKTSATATGATGATTISTGTGLNTVTSGNISLNTGTTVNGNSGDININPGVPSGSGTKGKIKLNGGSVAGQVWTATDALGSGNWIDPYSPSNFTASVTIANNQVAAADVTGLLFAGATYRSFTTEYWVYRTTATNEVAESGTIRGVYSTTAATWQISIGGIAGDAQVDFTITAAGQVQYTSSSLAGATYAGNMKFATLVKIPV